MSKYLTALTIFLSTSVLAAEDIDALEIYKNFSLMDAAVEKCGKPSQEQLDIFAKNYNEIAEKALVELKKRKPSITDSEAKSTLEKGTKILALAVTNAINKEGCKASKIQGLLNNFKMQLKLE